MAALYEEHGRMVYGVCRLVLRDPIEAEDAAQQTFLSAYRGLLAGQEPREPSAWLGTIARNECRSRLRARKSEPLTATAAVASDDTQRDAGRRVEIEALCAALSELPTQQRDAIVLREFYGLSYAEVAAALGLSGAAVESLLFRSRRRLQAQLRPMRSALGVLTLPWTLGESLTAALPGFGGAGAGAGAGAAVFAKVGSTPLAAKIAAATLAVGTAGTIAGVESHRNERPHAQAKRASTQAPKVGASLTRAQGVRPTAFVVATRPRAVAHVVREGRRGSGESRTGESRRREETTKRDEGRHEQGPSGEQHDQPDHSGPGDGEGRVTDPVARVERPEQEHRGDGGGDSSGSGQEQRAAEGSGSGSGGDSREPVSEGESSGSGGG